jgi:hypothetical protein
MRPAWIAAAVVVPILARWLWLDRRPPLFIDLKRVNDEDRRAHHVALYEDVEYRNRVKRRMTEGKDCPLKPLYDRPAILRRKRKAKVYTMPLARGKR